MQNYEKLCFSYHVGDPSKLVDEIQSGYISLKVDDERFLVITADADQTDEKRISEQTLVGHFEKLKI